MRSSQMMEYADSQLIPNLLTVICPTYQISALTHSPLFAICGVVVWPEQSTLTTLLLKFWNLSTHWFTFLCVMQFSPYCANILEGFTASDHRN